MLLKNNANGQPTVALAAITESSTDEEPVLATHVAMATYPGKGADGQLSFAAGEDIEVLSKEGHEQWRGRRRAEPAVVGTFPPEYLDVNPKPEASKRLSSRSETDTETKEEHEGTTLTKLRCKALFAYQSQYEDDELMLAKGQELTVTKQAVDGWWYGMTEKQPTGGWFPGNYCEVRESSFEARFQF